MARFRVKDHYFKKAKTEGFLARSVYKLEEIDKKYRVFQKGQRVLDLGYYPGSWAQYVSEKVGSKGRVVGVDIQPVHPDLSQKDNVRLMEKDLRELSSEDLSEAPFDSVISDMAPKTSGVKERDQAQSLELCEEAFGLAEKFLKSSGSFITKIFDGPDVQGFEKKLQNRFERVKRFKPKGTRKESKEFYLIAQTKIDAPKG
jgi:23S rRNA (uridine2552-2'-O)-methyltransferase